MIKIKQIQVKQIALVGLNLAGDFFVQKKKTKLILVKKQKKHTHTNKT